MLQMNLSSNVTHYDDVIFDYILVTLLFIGPAISFLEPVMPMIWSVLGQATRTGTNPHHFNARNSRTNDAHTTAAQLPHDGD